MPFFLQGKEGRPVDAVFENIDALVARIADGATVTLPSADT
jgi:hypothetical protein